MSPMVDACPMVDAWCCENKETRRGVAYQWVSVISDETG